ncbi:MAG: acetyl-CoA carboxylase biotin carboxylase subunit [Rhodospirillales bacterium]|jgi:acetyl-CoA carboxylase biotin carboxylase subunit
MFKKILIANRGAVAARVIRALNKLKIPSVAVYSEADAGLPYLAEASEAVLIGPAQARESYLNVDAILKAVEKTGADGVHPGYGFLSENVTFSHALHDIGVTFIGPSAQWVEQMGDKVKAREMMESQGLPMGAGSNVLGTDEAEILETARSIGFPLLIKAAGGGGGIGIQPVTDEKKLIKTVERARGLALRTFSNDEVYFEKLLEKPRHIEFQVLGDKNGKVRTVFERDCSIQRRYQKVIEEAPAPNIPREEIDGLCETIETALSNIGYDNIGTVEMLRGADGSFNFLEMNTRLQVEHGITEEITGIDLVAAQISSAAGNTVDDILPDTIERQGHAIEARVYAEDPVKFFPSPGPLNVYRPPIGMEGIRVDTGFAEGQEVTPFYDPMIAKVIAHGADRNQAIARLKDALGNFPIDGVKHNIPFLIKVLDSDEFIAGDLHTGLTNSLLK